MGPETLDERGLIAACPACGKRNRTRFDRLGQPTRCGQCQAELPPAAAPVAVTSAAQFDALVARSRLPVLVDFWAAWCGPCRMVAPQLDRVARLQAGSLLVAKIDTEALPDVAEQMGIQSIPTLAVFVAGREAGRRAGAMAAEQIEAFVRQAAG